MEDKALAQYNYCLEVVALKKNIELAFLTLGERLSIIRDQELYHSNWESFNDYLDEIKMSPSVASRLISVYQTMVLKYQIPVDLIANAGGWSNVYEITKVAQSKEEVERWLVESENRLPKDTKIALREAKSGIMQDECQHDYYTLQICRRCGDKLRVYEDNQPTEETA